MRAFGLQTHIANNNMRSMMLLAGFPMLLLLLMYGLFLLYAGLAREGGAVNAPELAQPFVWAAQEMARSWPFALIGAAVWFVIAYFSHQALIDLSTGAHAVTRLEEPRVYTLLENLCISRGVTPPTLRIIEDGALNAFASGLHEGQFSITVTRGLIETLDDQELETVLAHELTHIRNRDVRLLVVAVIFVGIFSFFGEILFRGLGNWGWGWGGGSSRRGRDSSDRSSGGAALLAIGVAIAIIAIAYALAIVIRFALSQRREYLADAGAVELTKNPDGLISALRKISGNHALPNAPAEVREMFIENSHAGIGEIFATHPPIEKRIAALIEFAGGRDLEPAQTSLPPTSPQQAPNWKKGPWG